MVALVSVYSLEYVSVKVSATKSGAAYNPTGDTVLFSFPVAGAAPTTWTAGAWETDGADYLAKILVGPAGTVTLPPGTYDVYVKVTDSPEIPVRKAGRLTIDGGG